MTDRYPTRTELQAIQEWNILEKPVKDLLDYIKDLWWMPGWGFSLKGKRVLRLELHTGGWSGNENIIDALKHNYLFWSLNWERSRRGGHYWFRIRPMVKP